MKRIWYHIVKFYIKIGLFFYFKKILVLGKNNIPKKGAVLLVSNHKNALIDPLLIATNNPGKLHFLTRASAFKITLVKWLLSTVNMLPIYRMRDGKQTLAKNEIIFNKCYQILNRKKTLLIFAEGTHDIKRWVRPLSKGFTRIAFGVFDKYPDLNLYIVPVGLNYTDATVFGESVSIYYGKPIVANTFFNKNDLNGSAIKLKEHVSEKMKELTTHIEPDQYEEIYPYFKNEDFLNPKKVNAIIRDNTYKNQTSKSEVKPSFLWHIVKYLIMINSFLALLIYKIVEPKIKEVEFISTTKFAVGVTAFPLFYLLQAGLIATYFSWSMALIYLGLSFLLVLILTKTK